MQLTQEQKRQLVLGLRKIKLQHERHLRDVAHHVALSCRRKVSRRVQRVSITMRQAQIRSVLDLERTRTVTAEDVVALAQASSKRPE